MPDSQSITDYFGAETRLLAGMDPMAHDRRNILRKVFVGKNLIVQPSPRAPSGFSRP